MCHSRIGIFALLILILSTAQAEQQSKPDHFLNQDAVTSVSNLKGFSGKTFSWMEMMTHYYSNPKLSDPNLQGMLQAAIANNLSAKGYVLNDTDSLSDFVVGYVAALDSSLNADELTKLYGMDPGLPELSTDLSKYEKGTLIVHMFNPKSGELLWRGALQAEVILNNKQDARKQRVLEVVSRLLRSFPGYNN